MPPMRAAPLLSPPRSAPTLALLGLSLPDDGGHSRLLGAGGERRGNGDGLYSCSNSRCCRCCRTALERVVGTELSPFGTKHGHHLGHGDLGVLLGNQRPAGQERGKTTH